MKFTYRPEIDGLRALAVISVVLYHSQFILSGNQLFSGGFIGVDIFFVISGYLISSIIIKEVILTKDFSFRNFYERRARRILPILFVVLLTTLILAHLLLPPTHTVLVSKSIIYSIGFSSNILFWFQSLQYGAATGFGVPLLHTWSLSVEEQFYLIFPIFFFFSIKYFKNTLLKVTIFLIIINLLIVQFGGNFNLNYPYINSEFKFEAPTFISSFMMTFSRPWELLTGVFISILEFKYGRIKGKNILYNLFSIFSLFFIFYAIFYFDDKMFYPSFHTLIPVLSTACLIIFCNDKNIITKLFSTKYFVMFGLISYSLYLWHYIILVFYRYYFITEIVDHKIIVIFLSILLSLFTYKCIERPFRNANIVKTKYFLICIFAFLILLVGSASLIIYKDGFYNKFNNKFIVSDIQIDNGVHSKDVDKYFSKVYEDTFTNNQNKKVLLIGNSFSRDLYLGFKLNESVYSNYDFMYWDTQVQCLTHYTSKTINKDKCNFNKKVEDLLIKADIILIHTKWLSEDFKGLDQAISKLKKLQKIIILTSHRPEFSTIYNYTYIDKFLLQNKKFPNEYEKKIIEKKYFKSFDNNLKIKQFNKQLKTIALKNNILYLNFGNLICSNIKKRCQIFDDKNKKLYTDFGHLTLNGAQYLVKKIFLLDVFK